MTLDVRPEAAADHDAIRQVNRDAFEGNEEASLVDELRNSGFVVVSLVAEVEGEIVGHLLLSRIRIIGESGSQPSLSLAPMAVVPSNQHQGIGTALVMEGLRIARELVEKSVFVLGHPAYYPRFGFSAELTTHFASPFGGGEAWMVAELRPDVLTGIQGRVEFPPPFGIFE